MIERGADPARVGVAKLGIQTKRFDFVSREERHATKKPLIDFSLHHYQFEHEGRRLLIRGEQDLQDAKLVTMTKALKIDCKSLYLCYVLNISECMFTDDTDKGGSSTSISSALSSKIRA